MMKFIAVSFSDLDEIIRRMKVPFFLSISYTASLGGTGTLIGSGAPLAFKGILEEYNTNFTVGVLYSMLGLSTFW